MVSNTSCVFTSAIINQTVRLEANRHDFSDGSVLTTCSAVDQTRIYSNTYLFNASQSGAVNGNCLVVYDLDAASTGFWEFTLPKANPNTGTATYKDVNSAANGRAFTMTCTTYK